MEEAERVPDLVRGHVRERPPEPPADPPQAGVPGVRLRLPALEGEAVGEGPQRGDVALADRSRGQRRVRVPLIELARDLVDERPEERGGVGRDDALEGLAAARVEEREA